jgi:hypothetical protein
MVLVTKGTMGVFIQVQVFFSFFNVIVKPPVNGLKPGVPGITGIITVTVIAGFGKDRFHILR